MTMIATKLMNGNTRYTQDEGNTNFNGYSKHNTGTGIRGVQRAGMKFKAILTVKGQGVYLGIFDTVALAKRAIELYEVGK